MSSQAEDAWSTASGTTYSPDRIYSGTSDRAGTVRKNTPIPASVLGQFEEMVDRRLLPSQLRTFASFDRDAWIHRLKYYADNGYPAADPLANMLIRIAEVEREQAERQAQMQFADQIEKLFFDAQAQRDTVGMEKALSIAQAGIGEVRHPYAERVQRVIDQARDALGY